jgi:lysozyme family protein
MASGNFTKLLQPLLGVEAGIADRPLKADPGGLTNKGVTHATYDAYRANKGLPPRSVRDITGAECSEIYLAQFWTPIRGDDLPAGLDWAVFDFAVNSGASRAVKDLQHVLGVVVDGQIGVGTLSALAHADLAAVINHYCDRRLAFMKGLKNWSANKNGWTARVKAVRAAALDMADPNTPTVVPAPVAPLPASATAKAPEIAQAQLKTPEGVGLTCAAAGAGGTQLKALAETVQVHVGMDTLLGRLAFVVFLALMLIGGVLIGYSYIGRIREKGGLGGLVGSVFKGESP